ncbi:hypothetical protein AURANDRAFT_25044, partial [Aureococcus anophagefferens]
MRPFRREDFGRASRTRREPSIRPKISRIDFDVTELESAAVWSGPPKPAVEFHAGKLGDCWLMCALSACAEFPEVIRALFPGVMQTFQSSGLYRVRLCTGGLWHTVTLDDYFPCDVGAGTPIFSRANGEELWVLLLEKAMAKLSGNYFRLRGGLAAEGL